jgi:hypothetical protein
VKTNALIQCLVVGGDSPAGWPGNGWARRYVPLSEEMRVTQETPVTGNGHAGGGCAIVICGSMVCRQETETRRRRDSETVRRPKHVAFGKS